MKGQLFIADLLASILAVTLIIAFTTWEVEQVYGRSTDIEYDKISSLASDIGQMAVKNILAKRSADNQPLPNWVDSTRWVYLEKNISKMIRPPYGCEASLDPNPASLPTIGQGACDGRNNVAVARRIVYMEGAGEYLTLIVKVCA